MKKNAKFESLSYVIVPRDIFGRQLGEPFNFNTNLVQSGISVDVQH